LEVDVEAAVYARTRGDEVTDDDVLLEAGELVASAAYGGVGQNARGLLEGGCADERLCGQRRLRDAEQQRLGAGGRLALCDQLLIDIAEHRAVDVLALEELAVAAIGDAHLLKHLAHDRADVLVIDLHALEAVDLLHLVEQVLLHRTWPLDPQDVVRIDRTLGEAVTGAHLVALVDAQVLADRHLVDALGALRRDHDDLALAALDLAEADAAVDLGDNSRVLRLARLE